MTLIGLMRFLSRDVCDADWAALVCTFRDHHSGVGTEMQLRWPSFH